MATLTPIAPNVIGVTVTPITPGSDSIPVGGYRFIDLVLRSVATGVPIITVDDPTSAAPDGTLVSAFNPDVTITVTAAQLKVTRLPVGRFANSAGNIVYTTAAPGDAVVYAIGIP